MAKKVKPGMLRGNTNENKLTADQNDYTLSIIGEMSYGLNGLAQLVVKSGVTTLREDQLVDGFRLIADKGIEMALQGNNVSYEYFTLRFGVKGVFNSPNEPFTRPKHEVTAIMSVGAEVQEEGKTEADRIKVTILLTNEPKHLMFMVPPAITKDKNYRIIHVSQAGAGKSKSGTLLKEPRTETSMPLKATDGTPIDDDDRPVIE